MTQTCKHCQKEYERNSKKQLYCSTKCRVYSNRNKKNTIVTEKQPIVTDKVDIVTSIVTDSVRKIFNSEMCTKHPGSRKGTCGCK